MLASNTVHDLVAGSGLTFESLGRRSLKGVFGERELFCLTDGSSPSLPSAVARPPDAV